MGDLPPAVRQSNAQLATTRGMTRACAHRVLGSQTCAAPVSVVTGVTAIRSENHPI